MSNSNANLIKYRGIVKLPSLHTSAFKQCNRSNIFYVPANAPNPFELLEVSATATPIQYEITTTSTHTKVSVIAEITLKFQYISNDETFYIHSLSTTYTFCDYITLNPTCTKPPLASSLKPQILIEDLFAHILSPQCIYYNLTMLICINFH